MKYIYFHICTLGHFQRVISHIMHFLQQSGILNEIQELRYGVIGDHLATVQHIMSTYPVAKLIGHSQDISLYERFTLHHLLEDCQKRLEPSYIMYIHSKGISHRMELYENKIKGWTEVMLTGLCTYRYLCWKELSRGADAAGAFYLDLKDGINPPHFSGNFWWATSTHIAKLGLIGHGYHDPEMWILGSRENVRFVKIDTFLDPPPEQYIPYSPTFSFPTAEIYTRMIVFACNPPFPPFEIPHSAIEKVDMGLFGVWVPCIIPPPGTITLTMDALGVRVDPHLNNVKTIIMTMKSGEKHYFKEGEIIHIY